jgi:hypothetical protein
VFDAVAVRTQDITLRDLGSDGLDRQPQPHHIADVEILAFVVPVVEFKSPVVAEPAPDARQGLLVLFHPVSQSQTAVALDRDFASLADFPSIDLVTDSAADLKL